MKYSLNFSLDLARQDNCVVYDENRFTDNPTAVTVPEVIEALECLVECFEEIGIIEKSLSEIQSTFTKTKASTDKSPQAQTFRAKPLRRADLKAISGKAYICQSKRVDEEILEETCSKLTEHLQKFCFQISAKNFLSPEINQYISGMREIIELRNYLAKYTKTKKKNYQNGYLYIVAL